MESNGRISALMEGLCLLLLMAAFGVIEVLIGGTRMVFSLPAYGILGVLGVLAIFLLRSARPAPSTACVVAAVLFFTYVLARAVLSPVPYIARSDIYSVLGGLVVYFFVACILTRSKQRMFFALFLLLFGIAHAFIGALQFRDETNFMPISWLQRYDYGTRASGFYVCPNHLAGFVEVVAVLGLSIVCWSRWPVWSKLLLGYGVAISYVALVLTGSRGGYLSTGASLLVFLFLSLVVLRRTSGGLFWKIGGAGLLASIVVGAAIVYMVSKSDFLTSRAQNTFETTNMRLDLWQSALEQWNLNPIFGTGSGTYLFYGRLFRTDRVQLDPVFVHNDYVHLLAEYGLMGAGGLVLFLGAHLWRGGYSFRRLGPKRVAMSPRVLSNALALNIGALAAVGSYVVHSVVDFNLHIPANLLLMAFVFGLLANDGVERDRSAASSPDRTRWWRLALPLLGVVLLVQCTRLLPGEYFSERSRAAVRDEQPAAAIRFALDGIRYDPRNPDLYFHLGLARLALGDSMREPRAKASFHNEAIKAFEQARSLVPQEKLYALELATTLDGVGRFEEAEWAFYDALQLDPKSDSLRNYYEAHLNLWRGKPPIAVDSEEAAP